MPKATQKKPEYLAKIFKEYGNIISSGLQVLEEKKNYKVISVSPAIDVALGGGIREGSKVGKNNYSHADRGKLSKGWKAHHLS